jgi:riboflavin biosynthesis protein RibD
MVMREFHPEYFMEQALLEGRKARSLCESNPPVGCVLVSSDIIIARGHTNKPGEPHAEAMALTQLSGDERDVSAYVTLEPCSFFGRTPSCAKTLVEHGVKEVFVGMVDPDSRNNGKGLHILEEAGIKVTVGILAERVKQDLEPYLASQTTSD